MSRDFYLIFFFPLKKPTRAPDWRVKVFKISLRFHWDIHIEILKFGKKILYLITNVLKLDFGSYSNAIFPHIRRTLCWLTFPLKATRGHDKKVLGLRGRTQVQYVHVNDNAESDSAVSITNRDLTQQCQYYFCYIFFNTLSLLIKLICTMKQESKWVLIAKKQCPAASLKKRKIL